MHRRLPPLSSLRAFEAAARHGSFKKAAEELTVTATAVSHHIRTLEERVGFRLFERRTRQVKLTDQGHVLYPVLHEGFDAFAAVLERLSPSKGHATVTISATMAFTAKWLVPRVARFQSTNPKIDLRLHASDQMVDLAANDVDIAIRYGRGPYRGLHAEVLFADSFAPVVNPALNVSKPADLRRVPLIHFEWHNQDPINPTWPAWIQAADITGLETASHVRFSDESHAIQAAVAGQGAALLSLNLVRDEIQAGRLTQPFGPVLEGMTYHLVTTTERVSAPPVAAALEWLRSEIVLSRNK